MTSFYLNSPFKDPSPPQSQPELLGLWTPVWRGRNSACNTCCEAGGVGDRQGGAGSGRPTWRGRRTLTLSQHPRRPMSAPPCRQAALPRTGSMPGIPPRAVTAGLGGGGDVTIPRPAGGDQRLWLEQGPGKTEPRLVSTTLGQAAKHLLGLDALPDSRPRPAPTGRRAPHPGRYRARSQELSPRVAGENHKGSKITLLPGAWANGLLANPLPQAARRVGLRDWHLGAAWIFPRGRGH